MFKWFSKLFRRKQKSHLRMANSKEQRIITALHEAAHAVCAHHSSYHSLVKEITIISDTTGESFVALSSRKASAAGKSLTPNIVTDPMVVVDAAITFFAGYEAEKIYCEQNNIQPDSSHSTNDYDYVDLMISNASPAVATAKEEIISQSNTVVRHYWQTIELIAAHLLRSRTGSLDAVSAIKLIQYGRIV